MNEVTKHDDETLFEAIFNATMFRTGNQTTFDHRMAIKLLANHVDERLARLEPLLEHPWLRQFLAGSGSAGAAKGNPAEAAPSGSDEYAPAQPEPRQDLGAPNARFVEMMDQGLDPITGAPLDPQGELRSAGWFARELYRLSDGSFHPFLHMIVERERAVREDEARKLVGLMDRARHTADAAGETIRKLRERIARVESFASRLAIASNAPDAGPGTVAGETLRSFYRELRGALDGMQISSGSDMGSSPAAVVRTHAGSESAGGSTAEIVAAAKPFVELARKLSEIDGLSAATYGKKLAAWDKLVGDG